MKEAKVKSLGVKGVKDSKDSGVKDSYVSGDKYAHIVTLSSHQASLIDFYPSHLSVIRATETLQRKPRSSPLVWKV